MQEKIQKIEDAAMQIESMAAGLLGDNLVSFENYMASINNCFLSAKEISDTDLNLIALKLPTYLYSLVELSQRFDMREDYAVNSSKYAKNEALLMSTGTVQEKQAKAENQIIEDKLAEAAYRLASKLIQKKIDAAYAILDCIKRVQKQRNNEKALTNMAGNSVGAF